MSAPRASAVALSPPAGARQLVADYVTLTKPRVQSLLLFTTVTTMLVAGSPSVQLIMLTCLGGYLSAGGAGAVNHAFDRDIDALMPRTADRPVPAGRVSARAATIFGCVLAGLSVIELSVWVNPLAAALALSGFLGYVFVYTVWLKRRTPQNIVIGGAAGAVPPLVGYAGATGHLGWAALVMFAVVFVWTPPHFWALALMIKEHYAKAGVPMLPVTRGDRETARQIVLYTAVLIAVTLAPVAFGVFGLAYGIAAAVLVAVFAWYALELRRTMQRAAAVRLFHYSLLYLALLFVAMAVDTVV